MTAQRNARPLAEGPGAEARTNSKRRHDSTATTPLQRLLDRLDAVRQTGPDRYMARCPAHLDEHPSLSIREKSDGGLLIFCFALCEYDDVLAAVGLEPRDLYPPSPGNRQPLSRSQRRIPATDVLASLRHEAWVVFICAQDLRLGKPLPDADFERLAVAVGRIESAAEAAHG